MNNYSDAPRVAIAGATGYVGQELVRLMARHPSARLTVAMSSGRTGSSTRLPSLAHIWDSGIEPLSTGTLTAEADAVFLALPDGVAAEVGPQLIDRGLRVFDLSGAFRLRDPLQRQRWYPESPALPDGVAVYGLPECTREVLPTARLVACPGCYPTAALLALKPLAAAGLLTGEVIIDAKSGVSGAGKTPSERTHFSECYGSISAYGVFSHRHAAEIEQELALPVTFVPHLVPLDRGILETIYAWLRPGTSETDVARVLETAYGDAPFVRLSGQHLPEIKHVAYTNFCDIGWRVDGEAADSRRRLILVTCIDNLMKGAAGQAVQNFNLSFGLDERAGLS